MSKNYEKEYFNWLCSFICDEEYDTLNRQKSYSKLLWHIFARPFVAILDRDQHRALDGADLRIRFCKEHGYPDDIASIISNGIDCSIFEMMLALALRCEETIMDDADYGNRTGQWFWLMIVNLGLGAMSNEKYDEQTADYILERFINREYSPYGEGGLFVVHNPMRDMREVEIWYQMCWYLTENF